uniref:Putative secreted protein n=1 Tax=Ixodes ricinus TaxID=34613 RepID=A0A6B0UY06_IXORI
MSGGRNGSRGSCLELVALLVLLVFLLLLLFRDLLGGRLAVLPVRVDELGQPLKGALPVVLHGLVGALLVQPDGGEALHLGVLQLVGRAIKLGNHQVRPLLLVLLRQLVVDRGQLLAVPAPGSVELDQDVPLLVEDHLVEVLVDEDLDGVPVPVLRQV